MGPDLAREGVKGGKIYKSNAWHYNHMLRPQDVNPESVMPPYPWLISDNLDMDVIPAKIRAMQTLGVPYPEGYDQKAVADATEQAKALAADLANNNIKVEYNKEIIAMIAYLQRLGVDITKGQTASK
jgi:cytochrome c oxidase cbb3-type subunit I/II